MIVQIHFCCSIMVKLFISLHVDVIVEPIRLLLFAEVNAKSTYCRRHDTFLRTPRDSVTQMINEVVVTDFVDEVFSDHKSLDDLIHNNSLRVGFV